FTDRTADDPVMGRIADHAYDGLAVTDSRGHVVYSNAAYLTLTGAAAAQEEEVRIAGQDGAHGRWLRMRVRPLGASKREAKYSVWSIADITRDRERQE